MRRYKTVVFSSGVEEDDDGRYKFMDVLSIESS